MNTSTDIVHPVSLDVVLEPADNERLANLCGPLDEHLRLVERRLGVEINNRGNHFRVIGTPPSTETAGRLLSSLYASTAEQVLNAEQVHLFLKETHAGEETEHGPDAEISIRTKRGVIRGRSRNQRLYLKNIQDNDVSFGIGPAGTGKTYLAVA